MTPNMANPFFIELIGESRAKHLQKIGALTGHSVDVSSVAFSPDGALIMAMLICRNFLGILFGQLIKTESLHGKGCSSAS